MRIIYNVGSDKVDQTTRKSTYGSKLNFLGANNNTDLLWMARYNVSRTPNFFELRLNIGDDINNDGDKFNVEIEKSGEWNSYFVVQGNGKVGIGTATPKNKLSVNGTIWG